MSENTITVTQVKSGIGAKPKTRGTLRALGLEALHPLVARLAADPEALAELRHRVQPRLVISNEANAFLQR